VAEATHSMTAAEVLVQGGPAVGLAGTIASWPAGATLAERLAANPYLMAPMAGVTNDAYRIMMRAGGAALAYTEMVSVAGLHYGGEATWDLIEPDAAEPEVAVQLFGSKPELFGEAARAVRERLGGRLALLDINMACPVRKVVTKGEGCALMDDPLLAMRIVSACAEAVDVPVTVKIRSARRAGRVEAPAFAEAMVEAGAQAVAVHGRFATQLYHGDASWDVVREVVEAVDVPVIGSGDVRDAATAARMREETGCAAVFVARGSYGNPWVFGDARTIAAGGDVPELPSALRRIDAFELHVRLLAATGSHMLRGRTLAGWYLKGLPHASTWRDRAMGCSTLDDFLRLADAVRGLVEGDAEPAR